MTADLWALADRPAPPVIPGQAALGEPVRHSTLPLPERPWNGGVVLDLCCCAGGASMGYWLAGWNVVGVDIEHRPNYPFPFVQADAIEYVRVFGAAYDLLHASWPCQHRAAITKGTNQHLRDRYPDLLGPGRKAMLSTGRPYVIETTGCRPDVVLCGTQFGLPILRHRKIETHGWFPLALPHVPHRGYVRGWRHGVYRDGPYLAAYGKGGGKATVPEMQAGLGIDWTDVHHELTEAIPPAMTRFLGEQAAAQLLAGADR
jgi:DNA (cytosine-5)-methyltransferase 1